MKEISDLLRYEPMDKCIFWINDQVHIELWGKIYPMLRVPIHREIGTQLASTLETQLLGMRCLTMDCRILLWKKYITK